MKSRHQSLVHRAIAAQLEIDPGAVANHYRLGADLGLDRFDLLMVGLRLAGWADGRGEFPAFDMSMAMTVADLVGLLIQWELGTLEPAVESPPDTLRPSQIPAEVRDSYA